MNNISIHPTALVSPKAQFGNNVTIGAFTIIEDDVIIGNDNEIRSSVILTNGVRIGNNNKIFAHAIIGTEPQDLKFDGRPTQVIIGNNNVIREFTTINRGTQASGKTQVGNNNLLMTYVHIAHDCVIGDNTIIANTVQLGGHVHVEDWVVIGAVAKVHQFCSLGCHSMIGGDCKIVKDVAPYTTIGREPPKVEGINIIGLRRRGFHRELIDEIKDFYKALFYSGLNNKDGIRKFRERMSFSPEIQHCIEFIEASERGIYR